MNMRRYLPSIAAGFLACGVAQAEPLSSMGVGVLTCEKFLAYYQADPSVEERFFDWAQGFMSAINDAAEDTVAKYRDLHSMPLDQQKALLRTFCTTHPTAPYRDGINAVLNRLTVVPSNLPSAPAYPLKR